jgi:hypothetical protein
VCVCVCEMVSMGACAESRKLTAMNFFRPCQSMHAGTVIGGAPSSAISSIGYCTDECVEWEGKEVVAGEQGRMRMKYRVKRTYLTSNTVCECVGATIVVLWGGIGTGWMPR